MSIFERDKADKLNRLRGLRIMNALGMVAWRKDRYGCAQQRLRMLHPLSWPWVLAVIVFNVVAYGVVEVYQEIRSVFREECVWW